MPTSSRHFRLRQAPLCLVLAVLFALRSAIAAEPIGICREAVIRGELVAGHTFEHPIGNGLRIWFQPVASGWILRIVPVAGPLGSHDYAELATPPYNSVSPLSLSTDFAFRAQDAVGWNPRRFRFAVSSKQYDQLLQLYNQVVEARASAQAAAEARLSAQLAQAAEGKLTILDSRLAPGLANQWRMASAVSSSFESTAHIFVDPPDGKPSQLGKLIWISFKLQLELPSAFLAAPGLDVLPHPCGSL